MKRVEPSRQTVIARITRVFPDSEISDVLAVLDRYGAEGEKEKNRVHLAILKLCDEENLSDPSKYVEAAKIDYRDVLAWAEYPNQMRTSPSPAGERDAVERIREMDRKQYLKWLDER